MTHTVVGLFDSKEEARDAMQALVNGGFVKEDVDLSNRKIAASNVQATKDEEGGVMDSVSNFFGSLFGEDRNEYQNFMNAAQDSEAILTVKANSEERAEKAADILDDNGAINVEERAAQYRRNYAETAGTKNEGEVTIPVVEENLEVGKKSVATGGVRVRSHIVEKPVEETVRLREEHVIVNRRPVDRDASNINLDNFKEGEIEITERAEKAVAAKEARVVEEVAVGKKVDVDEKTISDTVRRTEVEVDEINANEKARRATN